MPRMELVSRRRRRVVAKIHQRRMKKFKMI